MAFPDVPGNFRIRFTIGIGPVGVWPRNESNESCPPNGLSCDVIHSRKCPIASEPEGRSANETAFRVAASAAAPLNDEAGCDAPKATEPAHSASTNFSHQHRTASKVLRAVNRLD